MVFHLLFNILDNAIKTVSTNSKTPIACLPCEVIHAYSFEPFFDPNTGGAFQIAHPISLCDFASQKRNQMDMVRRATGTDDRTIMLIGNPTQILVRFGTDVTVLQKRDTVASRKHQMHMDL